MNTWGVVVAGGRGNRFGGLKQLEPLAGRRVLDRSLDALRAACAGVVVVVPADVVADLTTEQPAVVVAGGATRSASVRAGLAAIAADATHVLVHDAARPLASINLVTRVVDALAAGADGVVPVVAVTDTLRTVDGEPVDRSRFVAVQTPQGFDVEVLRAAHDSGPDATDDAGLLAAIGATVVHVDGESSNIKLTEPHDLQVAEVLLAEVTV